MANEYKGKRLKLWTAASYRITVEGHLDKSWSDRLGDMLITTRTRTDKSTLTTLVGRVRDQTELTGILNTLNELHLPILSVENFSENDGGHEGRQDPDN